MFVPLLAEASVTKPSSPQPEHDHSATAEANAAPTRPTSPGYLIIRRVATAIVLVSLIALRRSQFQGAGKTFAETFDWPMGGAIVVLYTMLGGSWAVSVTDMFQGLVMVFAAAALPIAALVAVGGFAGLAEAIGHVDVEGWDSLTRNMAPPAAAGFTLGLVGIGLGYPAQPHVVNRFMAMRDDAAIVSGRRIALAWPSSSMPA